MKSLDKWTCPAKYYDGHIWHWCERGKVHQPYHEYALEDGAVVQFDGRGMHQGIRETITNPEATSAGEVIMDPKVVAAADEAKRIEQIENEISQVLNWPLENRLMLLRHMRLQDDLEHVSTALRDLEVSIAVERKKRANA